MAVPGRDVGLLKPPHAGERTGRHAPAAGAAGPALLHRLDIERTVVADLLSVGLRHPGLAGHALLAIRGRILAPTGEIVLGIAAAGTAAWVWVLRPGLAAACEAHAALDGGQRVGARRRPAARRRHRWSTARGRTTRGRTSRRWGWRRHHRRPSRRWPRSSRVDVDDHLARSLAAAGVFLAAARWVHAPILVLRRIVGPPLAVGGITLR